MSNKKFGIYTLSGLVVANMIGAGVFTTSGFALGDLGSPYWVMLAWFIGGLVAISGAISYGYLARVLAESGGEYLFLSRNIHPLAGFIAGWVSLLAGFTGAIAYSAMTLESYFRGVGFAQLLPQNTIAIAVIVIAALAHGLRASYGTMLQNITLVVKFILLAAFFSMTLVLVPVNEWQGVASLSESDTADFSIYAFAMSLMWISFSYSGFNAAIYIAGEVDQAKKRIPKALLLGTVITVVVYLLLNMIFLFVPSYETVAFQEDVAAVVADSLGGNTVGLLVRIVIMVALFTSVSAMIMLGPRVYSKMADDGLMPSLLKFDKEIPRLAIGMQASLAIMVVSVSTLRELLSYLGFMLSLSAAATVLSLFVVVAKKPQLHLPQLRLPWYPWPAICFVVFTLGIAVLAAINEPRQMLAALITLGLGVLMYYGIEKFKTP